MVPLLLAGQWVLLLLQRLLLLLSAGSSHPKPGACMRQLLVHLRVVRSVCAEAASCTLTAPHCRHTISECGTFTMRQRSTRMAARGVSLWTCRRVACLPRGWLEQAWHSARSCLRAPRLAALPV